MRRVLFLAAACLLFATAAQAGTTVEGCDPRVMAAMQATAQARVAVSKSIDDEIYDQDDSVLALTCFNQAATVAAQQAGKIFSGDFTADLAPVVNDALTAMYQNFTTYSVGGKSGAVVYSGPGPGGANVNQMIYKSVATDPDWAYNCDQTASLWSDVNSSGIKGGTPYVTFDDIMNGGAGVPPTAAAGPGYQKSWTSASSKAAFDNMKLAVNGDGTAANPGLPVPQIPSFGGQNTPCDVLKTAGALPATTTCP
jgi:hypothetical protein